MTRSYLDGKDVEEVPCTSGEIIRIPTGWYYERSRKKYQQEQVKLRGDELRRFQKKFPKDQVITKEQLGMYLTTVACKPHIVSKGKNWVMKEFGNDISKEYRWIDGSLQ